jgi:hypothetical protein
MDLWIELTKLYALHEACQRLEHGVREAGKGAFWRTFSPTQFIYSYFTFNSIYSFDWASSIKQREVVGWPPDEHGRMPRETDQFKQYLRFCLDTLRDETPQIFARHLDESLSLFSVQEPGHTLTGIKPSNESARTRRFREAFPQNFSKLYDGRITRNDHYATLVATLMFLYAVRNNVFHGSKTRIEMEDQAQQQRLLIYSALLVASNGMLFEAVDRQDVPWKRPPVRFDTIQRADFEGQNTA